MGETGEEDHLTCVVCGRDPSSPGFTFKGETGLSFNILDPIANESFQPSPTLERTLEILSTDSSDSSLIEKSALFSILTTPEGAPCCCQCSVVLHKGLETAAEILYLETYLKNLAKELFLNSAKLSSSSIVSKYTRRIASKPNPSEATVKHNLPLFHTQASHNNSQDISSSRFCLQPENTCIKCKKGEAFGESGGGSVSCCCCLCGRNPFSSSSSSSEFQNYFPFAGDVGGRVVESFRRSPNLKKTLEILSKGTATAKDSGPLFDKSYVYRLLTSPEGGLCCFNCSILIHKGLETAAQILQLETYIKNLGRDIVPLLHASLSNSKSRVNSRFHRITANSSSSSFAAANGSNNNRHDIFSRFLPEEEEDLLIPEDLVEVIIESFDGETQEASVNQANVNSIKCLNKFPAGVNQCPFCAFSIDVRSVLQRISSPSSLTSSTRELLRKKATHCLTSHFASNHMPPGAKKKFKTQPNKRKVYLCYDSRCSYSAPIYFHVVMHCMRMHTREIVAPEDLDRLTCPEDESCSFEAHAKRKPDGTRVNNTFRYAKNSIAAHVFKEHDIPSHPSLQIVESKVNKLFAKTDSDSRKAYRCTRCDYFDLLPEKYLEIRKCRRVFLKHFYDTHLQT